MFLAIPPQPDCASAWLEASLAVKANSGNEAHNVIIGVKNPLAASTLAHPIVDRVDRFLREHSTKEEKPSVECIANTIFPKALYAIHGAPKFIDVFHDRILPKVRKGEKWSGYYFERMTRVPTADGKPINQLWDNIVGRINNEQNRALNKYEVSLFDPERDVNMSPYGGQCLSFLSFHLVPGTPRTLTLTAMYRNHYYTEKLLGNLIGLGRLMEFVADQTKTKVGSLERVGTELNRLGFPKGTKRDSSCWPEEAGRDGARRGSSHSGDQGCG